MDHKFNSTKCEHLKFTRKRQNTITNSYALHNTVKSKVPTVKYIGVKLQFSLRWNENTDFITWKAASRHGYIRCSIASSLPPLPPPPRKGLQAVDKTYSWVCMCSTGRSYPKDPIESTWGCLATSSSNCKHHQTHWPSYQHNQTAQPNR